MSKFKKRFLKTIFAFFAVIAVYIGWQMYIEYHASDYPPTMFPFDDMQATYTIKYNSFNNQYNIVYDTMKDREKLDTCEKPEPYGGISRCWVEGDFHTDIPIASSSVDLDEFVDKNVRLTGKFVYADKQCIKAKCIDLGRRTVTLRLESISYEKAENK